MIELIPKGPKIPETLISALNDDRLVFFCGSGISMSNNLPSFKNLVEQVCKKLDITIDNENLLKEAKEQKKYDLMLNLIEDKNQEFSVSRDKLRKVVIEILNNFKNEPSIHKSLLELSALQNNEGYRLVTTNFDRLFFKAGLKDPFCDSAPKLAPPRKETWRNLTFLHGVIDDNLDPKGSNLILTTRDFGLAYLYDNWASRFVIQLFQDFTVVFIGYSISDPVMNYLITAVSYENKRKQPQKKDSSEIKPFIYAFDGYAENREDVKKKWKALGIEPILYKIKLKEDHSLLYESIKEWAELKRTGLTGKRNWLKQKLKNPYREGIDKQKANEVIAILKSDKQLAEYFPKINLSPDSTEKKPVDISWLKAFAEEHKETNDKTNSYQALLVQQEQTKSSLLERLIYRTADSLWEPLSPIEKNIAKWLLYHLDKKELIHWLIKQAASQNRLIPLHPEFKNMLKYRLKEIADKTKEKLDERKKFFWELLLIQKHPVNCLMKDIVIEELNKEYSYIKARELLDVLEPCIGFEENIHFKVVSTSDEIYTPKLKINMMGFPYYELESETTLLKHAEDFTGLLKKAMELAEQARIIVDGFDCLYFDRPSIDEHPQNKNYESWTYLIEIVKKSFDLVIKKDKKKAKLLLDKWSLYPYSIFYRLIFYAITKHPNLDEEIVIKLFEEKPDQTLWSSSCQKEVLKLLRVKKFSKKSIEKLFTLIKKGPSRSLYNIGEEDADITFKEIKEQSVYQRLQRLKLNKISFPQNIEKIYTEIQKRYSLPKTLTKEELDKQEFPFYHRGAKLAGSERRYHDKTVEEVFDDIKLTEPNTYPDESNKENFRFLTRDNPEKAFEVLLKFQDDDSYHYRNVFIDNSYHYWDVFIYEICMIKDIEKSNSYFLKALEKIETYNDDFFQECLWSLIHGISLKGGVIYTKDNELFKKWWVKLWNLSIKKEDYHVHSNFSSGALNSDLGRLSKIIFSMLWGEFYSKNLKKDGKIPEVVKDYFKTIIDKGSSKDPSVLYHFGSYLWELWFLDKEWFDNNLKPLLNWEEKELCASVLCASFWTGYIYHFRWSPNFLLDFKQDIFELILHRKTLFELNKNDSNCDHFYDTIAEIFLIVTGARESQNIFLEKESDQLKTLDQKILESLSRQLWQLLKDSGEKSGVLWFEKIKPWIDKFRPFQTKLKSSKTAEHLSFLILHCGQKLPEAFEVLSDSIEGVIEADNSYMLSYIEEKIDKELNTIFKHPKELIQLLNWNLPKDKLTYNREKLRKILDKLKEENPNIADDSGYKKLNEKL